MGIFSNFGRKRREREFAEFLRKAKGKREASDKLFETGFEIVDPVTGEPPPTVHATPRNHFTMPELIAGYPSVADDLYDTGWIPVASSEINAIRWTSEVDPMNHELASQSHCYVLFKDPPSEYVYFSFPKELFQSFLKAGSKGHFLATVIKENFEYREMTNYHKYRLFPWNYAGPLGPHNTPAQVGKYGGHPYEQGEFATEKLPGGIVRTHLNPNK